MFSQTSFRSGMPFLSWWHCLLPVTRAGSLGVTGDSSPSHCQNPSLKIQKLVLDLSVGQDEPSKCREGSKEKQERQPQKEVGLLRKKVPLERRSLHQGMETKEAVQRKTSRVLDDGRHLRETRSPEAQKISNCHVHAPRDWTAISQSQLLSLLSTFSSL